MFCKLRYPIQYQQLMRQKEELEQTDTIISAPCVFLLPDKLCQRSDSIWWFDQFLALFLATGRPIWWQLGLPDVVNEQQQCFWLTGEICLGCLELSCSVLLLLVRRLLSCFIERCHLHLSSLTIWFYRGPPQDFNVQPMGSCISLALTSPSTTLASLVLWEAFMGRSRGGLISLLSARILLKCPCT